jgi:tRNA(Ile)-lysidine synthase
MTPRGNGSPYVRPFLCLTRSEIIDYLQANGFEYRIDSSNSDKTILRNRVRHELLPYLETFNPAIASRLAVTAETLAADEAVLDDIVACRFTEICNVNGREVSFSVASLLKQERGIRFRLYRRALKVVKGDLLKISFNNLKAMEHLITTASPNAETYLPDGVVVRRQYEALVVTRQAGPSVPFVLTIEGPGRYEIPGVGVLHVYFGAEPQQLHCSSRQIYVDGDVAPFPWTVRNFLPGDRIVPLGFNGHKKVKELMMEHQVPRNRRSKIPLVFAGDELIWVAGIRRGAGGLITSSTTRVVVAILEEDEFSTHL